jgi:hypothetical protein
LARNWLWDKETRAAGWLEMRKESGHISDLQWGHDSSGDCEQKVFGYPHLQPPCDPELWGHFRASTDHQDAWSFIGWKQ